MIGDDLYKWGYDQPLIKCVTAKKAQYIIKVALRHMRISLRRTNHDHQNTPRRLLLANMEADCHTFVKKCIPCQKHGNLIYQKQEQLHSILSPWPFAKWRMDILVPFSPGKGQVKFLIVAIDYFTKWIEAKPLATITTQQVQQFVWKYVICQYGVPHTIITDNGRQFIDKELTKFYTSLDIKHVTSSVEHPQINGQAEAANKVILVELPKQLDNAKGR